MKKSCIAAALALLLALPFAAKAADSGIYVAPKFVTGYQSTDWKVSAPGYSASKDSTRGIAGFSIAGGYDPMWARAWALCSPTRAATWTSAAITTVLPIPM